ncbi:hypothetical protein KKF82_06835 [Patescibacteria group bacterium]|nr:hypothetical protein [Patescibacteria group bacterium]
MVTNTAPPKTLTMEEYRRDWEPQGWELIIIGPTSTWRQDWGEWEAIRDIVQNALDETEAYRFGYDEKGLWIADKGKGVAVADFLLGPPKLKPDYARGKFGEGMKIAALALVRMGYSIHVETVGRELWIVFLEQKTNGHVETLAALWRPDGIRTGTMFHIIGYRGSAFEENFAVNLPKRAILAQGPSPLAEPIRRFNQLLDAAYTNSPKIYARDIYMRDISSLYSYNLWGFDMAPDRHAPKDESHMWVDMGRLWCCVTRVDLMRNFLNMVHEPPVILTDESHNVNMNTWSMGYNPVANQPYAEQLKESAAGWQQAWNLNFGKAAVIRTSDRWDNMVIHLGYTPHSVSWNVQETLSKAITTDKDIIDVSAERLREAEVIPDNHLSAKQLAHLELARAIVDKVTPLMTNRKVRAVHATIIPPASDRVRTAGMYSRATEEIYIDLSQLERGRPTVDTVIHELAHHTSGDEDLTEGHSNAMTKIAGIVVELTARGEFDELMTGITW